MIERRAQIPADGDYGPVRAKVKHYYKRVAIEDEKSSISMSFWQAEKLAQELLTVLKLELENGDASHQPTYIGGLETGRKMA